MKSLISNLKSTATAALCLLFGVGLPTAPSASAAWIALVNTNTGSIDQFSTGATFSATNNQQVVTLTDSQQIALHNAWPNCLWSNSTLWLAVSTSNLIQTINRDPLLVQEENFLKTAAQQVGITATNTPAQMNAFWTAAIAAATNNAQIISLVRQESKFWSFLSTLSLSVSGASTTNITTTVPIWSPVP